MRMVISEDPAPEEVKPSETPGEFVYLPIDQIIVNQQIRQNIDTESDGFKGLMESIREKGVLEPPLVAGGQDGGKYLLIAGERRVRACQMLGMTTIPVRILDQAATKADVITLQLIENLNRENLDPIDEARAYLEFFRAKIGPTDVEQMINNIMNYERDPGRVKEDFTANFAVISKITGKSTKSMFNLFSLLRLPPSIQAALREGKIGLSQGYLFAANLNNPKLPEIFASVLKKPVTYEALKKLLEAAAETDAAKAARIPFAGFYANIKTISTAFEKGKADYVKQDIEQLIAELETFCALLKEQAGKIEASAAASAARQPATRSSSGKKTAGRSASRKPVAAKAKAAKAPPQKKPVQKKPVQQKPPQKKPVQRKKAVQETKAVRKKKAAQPKGRVLKKKAR